LGGVGSGKHGRPPEQTEQQTDWKGRRQAAFLFVRSANVIVLALAQIFTGCEREIWPDTAIQSYIA
jgi:hypothetical protein